jgi:hypothetical protein
MIVDGTIAFSDIGQNTCTTNQIMKRNSVNTSWVCSNDNNSGGTITGSGIANYITKFTGATSLGDSIIYDNGTNVGIGTSSPNEQLEISGNLRLPATTATTGIIKSGANRFIHNYGPNNFFAGENAGNLSMTGRDNTGVGSSALFYNTTGNYNTASGSLALYSNTTGIANTASGSYALYSNTTGNYNTASGLSALFSNTAGYRNTASGSLALYSNTTGNYNTASGYPALYSNTTGYANTASGSFALYSNTTGNRNTAIGYSAGLNQTTGFNNIYVGYNVTGTAGESNVIRIGSGSTATYIAGISGATSSGGVAVYVNSSGRLGTVTSSRRFKEEIQDMGDVTDNLMKLRPVTFYYKPEYANGPRLLQYGLIAEEVAEVYPDLVQYSETGEPNTVYYQFVNAMLLNEVQKQHKKIEALEGELAAIKAKLGL